MSCDPPLRQILKSHPRALCAHFTPPSLTSRNTPPRVLSQVNRCQYVANSWSSIGCPRECPVVNGKVCGGAGICGWDVGLTAARCFCDNAQLTADCSAAAPAPATAATSTPVAVLAGSVVGGLVVGAVGVAATLLVLQRRGGAAAKPVDGFYGQ